VASVWENVAARQDRLCQHLLDYLAADVCEPEIAAHVMVREARVFEAQAVKQGRLQIVHVHLVFHDVHAEVVGLADYLSAFDAPPARNRLYGGW
jgi:hypothetical protein